MLTACCFRAQTSNLTVLRVFGTGADASFQLTLQPGTAGADGVTWPNGGLMLETRQAHLLSAYARAATNWTGRGTKWLGRGGRSSALRGFCSSVGPVPLSSGWVQGLAMPDVEAHISVWIGESM